MARPTDGGQHEHWREHRFLDGGPGGGDDMKLEVVTLPVSDVDRAKGFYQSLGWRLDSDVVFGDEIRGVRLTPPRSACSISFGKGLTTDSQRLKSGPDRGR
jgi:hypothetical protein